ncbi:MAG: Zn-ribbon domain-containing OB-fold protein [Thaumarchaeota archaeon]|nr:Zn-ribbon domain-containing OB-fold protein [Candidatus Calditenuaceae archaeon]MDW8041569.1 Zn-ribbon domain-containing OB-fold protein [Nitrososphaerota archaeon]
MSYLYIPAKWDVEFLHSAGEFTTRFLQNLKEKKIYGVRCPRCNRVLLPPRRVCDRCFVETTDWVEVSDVGTLQSFCVVYRKFWGLPDPPYAIGVFKLDGSDEALVHFIGGVDLTDPTKLEEVVKIGRKFRAVWAEERRGHILDIKYFEPMN